MADPVLAIPAFLRGLSVLWGVQAATALLSYALLRLVRPWQKLRVFLLLVLGAGYHLALLMALSRQDAWFLGVVLPWLHLGFVFRFLSSVYFHRSMEQPPSMIFHVVMLLWAPRQHYGARGWGDLTCRRIGRKLLGEWGLHTGYSLLVVGIAGAVLWFAGETAEPVKTILTNAALFIMGLEVLTFGVNIQWMSWAPWGRHPKRFFGNFALLRSVHVGQWWQNWNVHAVVGLRELSKTLGLSRHHFANTMTVFAVSGLLHQLMVYYFTRRLSYGTMLAFLIHGALVYFFTRLYHHRKQIVSPLRLLIFNPVTNMFVTVLAGLPFVMDFSHHFDLG